MLARFFIRPFGPIIGVHGQASNQAADAAFVGGLPPCIFISILLRARTNCQPPRPSPTRPNIIKNPGNLRSPKAANTQSFRLRAWPILLEVGRINIARKDQDGTWPLPPRKRRMRNYYSPIQEVFPT